jgi:hypothetical protein
MINDRSAMDTHKFAVAGVPPTMPSEQAGDPIDQPHAERSPDKMASADHGRLRTRSRWSTGHRRSRLLKTIQQTVLVRTLRTNGQRITDRRIFRPLTVTVLTMNSLAAGFVSVTPAPVAVVDGLHCEDCRRTMRPGRSRRLRLRITVAGRRAIEA